MISFPLDAILFWIAIALAPHGTSQILVKGPDATWAWTQQDAGWSRSTDRSAWVVEGETVKASVGERKADVNVGQYVQGVKDRDWSKSAKLTLPQNRSLAKEGETFVYTFDEGTKTAKPYVIRFRQNPEAFGPVIDPKNPKDLTDLGNALMSRGQLSDAIGQFEKALQIKPDYVEAHVGLGSALAQSGKLDEAMAQYRKALEIKPNSVEARIGLADSLVGQKKLDEAMAQLRQALELKPDSAEAHSGLAKALVGMGRLDEASAEYRKALAIKPDSAEAHNGLGNALTQGGKLDEAIAHYRKALEIKPDYAAARQSLAAALSEREKRAKGK